MSCALQKCVSRLEGRGASAAGADRYAPPLRASALRAGYHLKGLARCVSESRRHRPEGSLEDGDPPRAAGNALLSVTPENRAGAQRNNTSGYRGVSWWSARECWKGTVYHNGRPNHVGYFSDPEEANRAVIKRRNELFTHNQLDRASA